MKQYIIPLLALALLLGACTKDGADTAPESSPEQEEVVPEDVTPSNPEAANCGAGSYTFASTGDKASEDDVSNTTFTRKINITYSAEGVSVEGDDNGIVTVDGQNVTVQNTGKEAIVYQLSGSASNGSFKLYSEKKQALLLDNLYLTCTDGAAINNQSGKRTFVMVEGTNVLSDASSALYTPTDAAEDMKAVFFSEGQLLVSGSGSLKVTARNTVGKAAIATDDYFRVLGNPTLTVSAGSSAGHGIRGKDYVQLSGGTLDVTVSAPMKKGISSDDYVLVEDGTHTVTVSGSAAWDEEDGEYSGTAGVKADNYFGMTGGTLTITNTGNGGKGIHAGSYDFDPTDHAVADSYISGGTLSITTKGTEVYDVSTKGIKIGWATKDGTGEHAKVTANAGNLLISGGCITVSTGAGEGIEAKKDLTISGGEIHVTSAKEDAINSQGEFSVTGGYIYAYSAGNDGMDANGNMRISGGYVMAITTRGSPEVALDANTEEQKKLYISGTAVVVAYGGLERGYSASNPVKSMQVTAGSWNALTSSSGEVIAAFKTPAGLSSVALLFSIILSVIVIAPPGTA